MHTQIAHQFEEKFGKEFAHQAKSNLSGTVNAKVLSTPCTYSWGEGGGKPYSSTEFFTSLQVIHRLGVEPIKKSLIENYLVEIARNYHQEYQPDPSAFLVS